MKKRYLVFTIFLMFLLFLPLIFGGDGNGWKKCSYLNDEKDETYHHIELDSNNFYCCYKANTHKWQPDEECCIDNDGDGYGDPGNKDCAKGIETDCNDGDANINPGINENTGDLCSDGIDNNCNQDNNVAWDDVSTTGVDCKDLGCAGKTGLANVCCQSVTDCSSVVEGNCGAKSCSSNECIVTVDSDTSTRCSGLTVGRCGISAGTCSVSGDGFSCDMTGDDDKCTCDHYCGGAPSYGCVSLSNNCDSIIYSVCNDPDLAPADKALCVCYGHYSPSSGCDTDYPNTGSTSVGGGIC